MINIHRAESEDIESMVDLSYHKRREYEKAQPQFWRYAGEKAEKVQQDWFNELLEKQDYILLVAKEDIKIVGFIIGRLVSAPEVYDPGGLTLMIDDFCSNDWSSIGDLLLKEIAAIAKTRGASQYCIVAGDHDKVKCSFLEEFGLKVASRWYVGSI